MTDLANPALQVKADWYDALIDFREGRPANLAAMMRRHPIPNTIARELADAIEQGLPVVKNADKRKIDTKTRREILFAWHFAQRDAAAMRRDAAEIGDKFGKEPSEVLAAAKEFRSNMLKVIADKYGVSTETVRRITSMHAQR